MKTILYPDKRFKETSIRGYYNGHIIYNHMFNEHVIEYIFFGSKIKPIKEKSVQDEHDYYFS